MKWLVQCGIQMLRFGNIRNLAVVFVLRNQEQPNMSSMAFSVDRDYTEIYQEPKMYIRMYYI